MASAITTELLDSPGYVEAPPLCLIESRGLFARLTDEVTLAWRELRRDPRGFTRAIVFADTKDLERRRRLYFGFACGFVTLCALVVVTVALGWHRILAQVDDSDRLKITMIDPNLKAPDAAAGPKNLPRGDGGGGGGGHESPAPVSKGARPLMLPRPPIVQITDQPSPTTPLLPVQQTIVGPESPPPPPDVPVGDPSGKPGDASAGRGSGGGVGEGAGSGAGPGTGPGGGPGRGGGGGGGNAGSPGGTGSEIGAFDFNRKPAGYVPFSWIYRARAIVTPEAQENKVIGVVFLKATFNADGTITDIEVRMPVEFMTESAIESLKRSRFRPATVNGKPVTVRGVPISIAVHY
ncbi:MAG TPA: energy transducer TonB [Blastocatellia bacterium]|nr:energy transducer TonB [Blastocatellia bacterium]